MTQTPEQRAAQVARSRRYRERKRALDPDGWLAYQREYARQRRDKLGRKGRPHPSAEQQLRNAGVGRSPDECWPWPGACNKNGYGSWRGPTDRGNAHRVALQRALGRKLTADELACHRCDNPPCVNPAHLFVGSVKDNSRDMRVKLRQAHLVLTDSDVLSIRARYAAGGVLQRELAAEFGVSQAYVSLLIRANWEPGQPRPRRMGRGASDV